MSGRKLSPTGRHVWLVMATRPRRPEEKAPDLTYCVPNAWCETKSEAEEALHFYPAGAFAVMEYRVGSPQHVHGRRLYELHRVNEEES